MMKSLSVAYTLLLALSSTGSSSAFAPTSFANIHSSALGMSESNPNEAGEMSSATVFGDEETAIPSVPVIDPTPAMSQSIPFMAQPAGLTGALAGDVGFDPLGFAKTEADLMNYREAEVKHARLAMLAAAGWPLSEVFDRKIAASLGMDPLLDGSDRVPSLLNGGLGKISPLYWIGCIVLAAGIDWMGMLKSKNPSQDYLPGDFGLRLGYPSDDEGKKWMQTAEIKNGRLAMIAVFGFAIQEFVSKQGVVDETPFFFFPIIETLHKYANSGYIQ